MLMLLCDVVFKSSISKKSEVMSGECVFPDIVKNCPEIFLRSFENVAPGSDQSDMVNSYSQPNH